MKAKPRLKPASIRSRLVAVFAVGSSVLLVLACGSLYIAFNSQLNAAIDQSLRDRAADITLDLKEGNVQIRPGEPFAALVEPTGQVIEATIVGLRRNPVLTPKELSRVRKGEVIFNRRNVTGLGGRGRVLARPETTNTGRNLIVVVGESLDAVNRAPQRLGALLGFVSPVLIGVVAWCGWVLVGAVLRPVRRLTEEAAAISLRQGGERLRQPPGDDEIALLGRTLNDMLGRIEASLAHERAFVDDASHELRTPISILRGELELAVQQPQDGEETERALHSALQEAERLGYLTENLLVLARADRGRLEPGAQRVDLRAAAEEVVRRHSLLRDVDIAVTGGDVVAAADPVALDRVIDNLVANARRHARTRVRVDIGRDGERARLVVVDDGPGFPPEFLPVAFDRFSRADATRDRYHGGTGLGLAIVGTLVNAQGGWVQAGNDANTGGGRVTVTLPLVSGALMVPSSP